MTLLHITLNYVVNDCLSYGRGDTIFEVSSKILFDAVSTTLYIYGGDLEIR